MQELVLVADNIRSIHNVGSLLRTCDCLGIKTIYLCGITPHLSTGKSDTRLPHVLVKLQNNLHKTALGAEKSVDWHYSKTTAEAINKLKQQMYTIVALEQDAKSVDINFNKTRFFLWRSRFENLYQFIGFCCRKRPNRPCIDVSLMRFLHVCKCLHDTRFAPIDIR